MCHVCPERSQPWGLSHLQRLYKLIGKQPLYLQSILGQSQFPKGALDFFQQCDVEPSQAVLPGVLVHRDSVAQLDERQVTLGVFAVDGVLYGQLGRLVRMVEHPLGAAFVCFQEGRERLTARRIKLFANDEGIGRGIEIITGPDDVHVAQTLLLRGPEAGIRGSSGVDLALHQRTKVQDPCGNDFDVFLVQANSAQDNAQIVTCATLQTVDAKAFALQVSWLGNVLTDRRDDVEDVLGVNIVHGLQLLAAVSGKEQGLQVREGDIGIASQDMLHGGPTTCAGHEGKFQLRLTKPAKFLRGKDVGLLRDWLAPAGHAYGRGGVRASRQCGEGEGTQGTVAYELTTRQTKILCGWHRHSLLRSAYGARMGTMRVRLVNTRRSQYTTSW